MGSEAGRVSLHQPSAAHSERTSSLQAVFQVDRRAHGCMVGSGAVPAPPGAGRDCCLGLPAQNPAGDVLLPPCLEVLHCLAGAPVAKGQDVLYRIPVVAHACYAVKVDCRDLPGYYGVFRLLLPGWGKTLLLA